MGLMSFLKEAGEKLFGRGEAKAAQDAVATAPTAENVAALSRAAGAAIINGVNAQGLPGNSLDVSFNADTSALSLAATT